MEQREGGRVWSAGMEGYEVEERKGMEQKEGGRVWSRGNVEGIEQRN